MKSALLYMITFYSFTLSLNAQVSNEIIGKYWDRQHSNYIAINKDGTFTLVHGKQIINGTCAMFNGKLRMYFGNDKKSFEDRKIYSNVICDGRGLKMYFKESESQKYIGKWWYKDSLHPYTSNSDGKFSIIIEQSDYEEYNLLSTDFNTSGGNPWQNTVKHVNGALKGTTEYTVNSGNNVQVVVSYISPSRLKLKIGMQEYFLDKE